MAQRLLVLRLRSALLRRADRLRDAVRERVSAADYVHAWSALALAPSEHAFARELLERCTRLWLYRTNQRAFAGDFIVVDMSSPAIEKRRVFALELKTGARVREDRAGVQLARVGAVIDALVACGVAPNVEPAVLCGDGRALLRYLAPQRVLIPSPPRAPAIKDV